MKQTILLFLTFFTTINLWAQPANDNLCDAVPLTVGVTCTGTLNIDMELATSETNEPQLTCGSVAEDTLVYNSVWYSFVAPAGEVFILAQAENPTIFAYYQMNLLSLNGDCADLSNLESVDCSPASQNLLSSPSIRTTLIEGETYYLQVFGYTSLQTMTTYSSPGCISIIEVSPPANDDVCNAIELELNADPQVFNNLGATAQPGEFPLSPPAPVGSPLAVFNDGWALGTNFIDNSVWFTFTTPPEGGNVSIDLLSSTGLPGSFNTQVAVYEAVDCNDFTTFSLLGAGDNALVAGPVSVNSKLDLFCLEGSTTYYVLVDGGASFLFMPIINQGYFSIQATAPELEDLSLRSLVVPPVCTGGDDGSIIVNGEGGAGEFTYMWSNGDSVQDLRLKLEAGEYTITLTDRCGNELVETYEVAESQFGQVTANAGMDLSGCSNSEVMLEVEATGGMPFDVERLYAQTPTANFPEWEIFKAKLLNLQERESLTQVQDVQLNEMEFAGDELYGYTSDSTFYQINTSTGELTMIGTLLTPPLVDLSYVPSSGTLYAVSNGGEVYEIDPATAGATLAVSTGLAGISLAAIDGGGTIFAFLGSTSEMYSIPLSSGTPSLVATLPYSLFPVRAAEIDPTTDKLYLTASTTIGFTSGITWQAYNEIDKTTGETLTTFQDFNAPALTLAFAIKNEAVQPYTYTWTPSTGLDDANISSPTFTVNETTTFSASASDACNAGAVDMVMVQLLPDAAETIEVELVSGEEYNGVAYTENTVLTEFLIAANGCDSVLTTNITVTPNAVGDSWPGATISLSPNPTSDQLTLTTDGIHEPGVTVLVRDVHGRILMHKPLLPGQMTLNVSHFNSGHYLVQIRSADKFAMQRFVKI